ncbi:uncharacterized protein LOC127101953 [Lathyrus oleraceus]|uniref:uncharacterized protein LOC127101953 n=1 Tax=Pisum sativum TaxID=3888 RepID=UPI0021D2C0F7|nr:uncharacterized protein LOC127101953 [Pisum sativum]
MDPIKYIFEKPGLTSRIARWQMLLSEYDIQYVTQKAIKGSVLSEYLGHQLVEDYQSMRLDFPDKDVMYIRDYEIPSPKEGPEPGSRWTLVFDGASNALGNIIGAVITSPKDFHLPFTARLCFKCTNNMAEYEACILGIEAAIDLSIKILEVYGDSALRENQLADALATLSSMFKVKWANESPTITIQRLDEPAHCLVVEAEIDGKPWFYDIKRYLEKHEYPNDITTPKLPLERVLSLSIVEGTEGIDEKESEVVAMLKEQPPWVRSGTWSV